jgi:hypothetical protein
MENNIPLLYVGDFPISAFITLVFRCHNQPSLHQWLNLEVGERYIPHHVFDIHPHMNVGPIIHHLVTSKQDHREESSFQRKFKRRLKRRHQPKLMIFEHLVTSSKIMITIMHDLQQVLHKLHVLSLYLNFKEQKE